MDVAAIRGDCVYQFPLQGLEPRLGDAPIIVTVSGCVEWLKLDILHILHGRDTSYDWIVLCVREIADGGMVVLIYQVLIEFVQF